MTRAEQAQAEVAALEGLNLEALREAWRRRYGLPPRLRSAEVLRLMLAWRIQAAALGGLDAETRCQLRRPVAEAPTRPAPSVGARITREWGGTTHVVESVDGGFLWKGERYASLSKVAQAITGAKWNGPRFFGLRAAA